MKKEFHILVDDKTLKCSKATSIIAEHTLLSKQVIKQAMKKGALWIEDSKGVRRLRRADTTPPIKSTLHLYYDSDILELSPPIPTLIADEIDYSIWSKPSGMLSQGSKWGDHCTINRWIEVNTPFETHKQRNCFIVHRLDRAARGLMLIAHKKNVAAKLAGLFERREISKCYRVIVAGKFPKTDQIMDSNIDDKTAYSSAKLTSYCHEKNRSLLEVTIKTGRKHQIRVHLSRSDYPVIGDRLHGTAKDNKDQEELQLCAYSLGFTCPITDQGKRYKLPEYLELSLL